MTTPMESDGARRWTANLVLGLAVAFLLAPAVVVVVSSFTSGGYPRFPPQGWSLRWYRQIGDESAFMHAFFYSLKLAVVAALISTGFGATVAFTMIRHDFPGRSLLEAIFMAPLGMPGLVLGLGLLQMYSTLGVSLSFWTLLIGHVLVTMPFSIRMVTSSLAGFDIEIERAAMTLGAPYWVVLRTITLPALRAGLFGAFIFSFIISFDELPVSLFLSNIMTTTLPIKLYGYIELSATPLVNAVSTLMLVVGILTLVLIERVLGLQRAFMNAAS